MQGYTERRAEKPQQCNSESDDISTNFPHSDILHADILFAPALSG